MREKRLQVRTHYIHRIKYSTQERLVGSFVLLAIILLVWLLFSSGKSLINFEEHYLLYGQLETIQQIDENTEIIIGGLSAGRIQAVKITHDNHIIVVMEIPKRYKRLIRTDSIARLNAFDLGMINQSIIEISVGSPKQAILEDGHTIVITETASIKNLLAKFVPSVEALFATINRVNTLLSGIEQQKLEKTLNNIDSLVAAVDPAQIKSLLENLHFIINNAGDGIPVRINSIDKIVSAIDLEKLRQTTNNINLLIAAVNPDLISAAMANLHMTTNDIKVVIGQIKKGKGLVGRSIYDRKIEQNFVQTISHLSHATEQLDRLLSLLNKEMENMPGLLNKIEPLINEADKTIKATQKIWPISSAIEKKGNKKILISAEPLND
ncbi:MAG: hypothetical protein KZQ83_08150 [gamma proteobacterium symbiont of Taylorina sp.]|nr:hypothetical protein [gamma proteobacterium symbiont of Taylorina sp.]